MKFPLVTRTRFDREVKALRERVEKLKAKAAQARDSARLDQERVSRLQRELEAEQGRRREVERICEVRAGQVERLQEVEALCEARATELKRVHELQKLCESRLREIEILRSQLAASQDSCSRLLEGMMTAKKALLRDRPVPLRSGPIPVVIGVDVEPDAREVDRDNPSWDGAAAFFKQAPTLREALQRLAGKGMVFSWFPRADPQVQVANGEATYAFHRFEAEWREVRESGDEIGLHMHPWRWDKGRNRWVQDHEDAEWMAHCVRSSVEAYRKYFGSPPASYRGGDRFLNDGVVRLLESLGIQVDLSVELAPGVKQLVSYELGSGSIPDTSRVPNRAYRPCATDFRKPDPERKDGLGIMPLTGYPGGQLPLWTPHAEFKKALELVLLEAHELTHLAFVVRANIARAPEWDTFVENVKALAGMAREGTLEFTTALEAWRRARDQLPELARLTRSDKTSHDVSQ